MKPITRKEYYLAKAAGTYTGPTPPPVLREDYYLATLSGDYSGNCPAPVTRLDMFMSAAAGLTSYVPQPVTRIEKYWYAIAKGAGYVPEPVTREEKFLYAILKNPPKPEYLDKTAEGNPILLTDSAEAPLTALTVYGHSTQDGTPSPDNPVPIVSAGDNGEINVSVSDGGTQSQTLTLSTPGGLPGIPVDSGGNYTDENGQQWVCDEIDLARGKYVQRVGTETIDGGYNLLETSDVPGRFVQHSIGFTNLYKNGRYESICNIASWSRWGFVDTHTNTNWLFALSRNDYYISPPSESGIESAEELNNLLNSLEFPVVFAGQLATPIETDLTAEEIDDYQALRTYSPNTTVSNDAAAWMKVGYKANP